MPQEQKSVPAKDRPALVWVRLQVPPWLCVICWLIEYCASLVSVPMSALVMTKELIVTVFGFLK